MKRILNILYFITLLTVISFAQTVRYVSPNGNNTTGTSWATAWTSFASITWNDLAGGGTLYLDGGTDSVVYSSTLNVQASGTAANHIVIRNSYESGHNGRVILNPNNYSTDVVLIGTGAGAHPDHITLKGLEITHCKIGIYIRYAVNDVVIDSCIITDMGGRGIEIGGGGDSYDPFREDERVDSIFVRNCTVITPVDIDSESDCMYWQWTTNIYIENNYFHTRNLSPINNHSDVIQSNLGAGELRIVNNILISDSNAQGMPIIIGHANFTGSDTALIYNNYMYGGGIWYDGAPWVAVFNNAWNDYYWSDTWTGGVSNPQEFPVMILAHNTIVSHGPYVAGTHFETPILAANNIIVQFGDAVGFGGNAGYWLATTRTSDFNNEYDGNTINWSYPWETVHVDSFRNNLMWTQWRSSSGYYENQGYLIPTTDGTHVTAYDWTDWTNAGGTGINQNPDFVQNILGFTQDEQAIQNGELQSTSPARNQGENLQALIESLGYEWADINGNPRDATPDLGAYEYVDGLSVDSLPNAFTFTDVTNAELSTVYTSNTITLTGFDSCYARAGGQEYSVNSGSWVTGYTKVFPNDNVRVRRTSSSSYSTAINTTLTVGSRSDTYTITTKSAPTPSGGSKVLKTNGGILKDSTGKIIKVQE